MKKIKNSLMDLNLSEIIALISAVISVAALILSITALIKSSCHCKRKKIAGDINDYDIYDDYDEDAYEFTLSDIDEFENDLLRDSDEPGELKF